MNYNNWLYDPNVFGMVRDYIDYNVHIIQLSLLSYNARNGTDFILESYNETADGEGVEYSLSGLYFMSKRDVKIS